MVEDNKNRKAANSNVEHDRQLKLPSLGEGSRFLVMRRTIDGKNDDLTMRKINPILAGRIIRGTGSVIDMKLIHDGGLLIKAKDYKSANSIFQITGFCGFKVNVSEYTQLNKSTGVIFDRSLTAATDEEIKEELAKHRCIRVKRVQKTLPDGSKVDTGTFFLTFGTVVLPKHISIGYSSFTMTPYVPNPTRCFKCQKFGHVSASCKAPNKLCVHCGKEDHVGEGQKCTNPAKCLNCDSSQHNSMSRDCPEFLYRKKIEEIKVNEQKSHFDATKLLNDRDPMAKPSKNPRSTFSSTLKAALCTCGCKCGAKAPENQKRKQVDDLQILSDEEILLRNKAKQPKKAKVAERAEAEASKVNSQTEDEDDDEEMVDENSPEAIAKREEFRRLMTSKPAHSSKK